VGIRSGVEPPLLTRESELERLVSAKADLQTRLLSGKHTPLEADAAKKELDALIMELESGAEPDSRDQSTLCGADASHST
jgi:hypothetical protein